MKRLLKVILVVLILLVLVVAGYVGYVFLSYKRLPEKMELVADNVTSETFATNQEYKIMSYNIGYGAYPADYSFFMDGGKYSRAYDEATVEQNMLGIIETTADVNPDIALFQEVDEDGDRSFHVNEVKQLRDEASLPGYSTVYAQNYDSAYLFYPVTNPIGKAKSGIVTSVKGEISQSTRYSLPIDTDFNKFFDLDRALSVSEIPVKGDKTLTLINLHLSAFTKNREVRQEQLNLLFDQMTTAYEAGHYVIVGGDYNHDMLGNSPTVFGTQKEPFNWTHPFPESDLPAHFQVAKGNLAQAGIPSVRRNNEPYVKGESFVSIVDGFLVSDNVKVKQVAVIDNGFTNSDHNPITMDFTLVE